jgi:hypothetical protein
VLIVDTGVLLAAADDDFEIPTGRGTGFSRDDASFKCGLKTDNGWKLGNSDPIGECSYTFPDDLEDDEP